MNLSAEPTIDDIRKMGEAKRPKVKPPPPPKKINKKKVKEPEPIPEPEPEPEPKPESESESEESEEEVIIPIPKKTSKKKIIDYDSEILKQLLKTTNKKDKDYDTLFKSITDIKELIVKQKDVIEEVIKPKIEETKSKSKPKPKAKPKPKPIGKKLDLVVSDKELEAVLNPLPNTNVNANAKPIDPKLAEFLKAFQK